MNEARKPVPIFGRPDDRRSVALFGWQVMGPSEEKTRR